MMAHQKSDGLFMDQKVHVASEYLIGFELAFWESRKTNHFLQSTEIEFYIIISYNIYFKLTNVTLRLHGPTNIFI